MDFLFLTLPPPPNLLFSLSLLRYHELYLRAKGNQYRNKSHLMEFIWKAKGEKQRQEILEKQAAARRSKAKALKAKRVARKMAKVAAIGAVAVEEKKE